MVKVINSEIIQHKITTLINAILNTGYTPKLLNRSIIIPIIKDRNKEEFDCNNYRPISVSNVIVQILEKVIFLKFKELQNTSELQFGFKKQISTLHTGLQPKVKAFLYNTYCKPIGTYGMGIMSLKGKTLQQLNVFVFFHVFF
jgi:hypothetical protein